MSGAPAARVEDAIAHSGELIGKPAGMSLGIGVMAVIGIAAIVIAAPTGILLAAAIIGLVALANDGAQLGAGWGGSFGKWLFPEIESGRIKKGATTIFVGKDRRAQARIEDEVGCTMGPMLDMAGTVLALAINPLGGALAAIGQVTSMAQGHGHFGAQIAEGCLTVIAEGKNAARVGCKTTCAAWVSKGEATVILGKELGVLAGYEGVESETPGLDSTLWASDWVGAFAGYVAAVVTLAAGVTIASVGGVAAAVIAIMAKATEEITGDKRWGFGDDFAPAIEIVAEAANEARKQKGTLPKIGVFVYKVGEQLLTEGKGSVPMIKGSKRANELLTPAPKPKPVIPSSQ